jgi:hypothetical protein
MGKTKNYLFVSTLDILDQQDAFIKVLCVYFSQWNSHF